MIDFACGIRGMGFSLPTTELPVAELASKAGLPDIVVQFAGARTVRQATPGESPSSLAIEAARRALDRADMTAADIDLVLWCGAAVPDHLMPTSAGLIHHALGCSHAQAFDVAQGCATMVTGLQVAHGLMALDPACRTALLAGGDTWGSFTLHHNADSVFFGDAGGALVVQASYPHLRPLSYHSLTRGDYYGLWTIDAGGACRPASAEALAEGAHIYRCQDPLTAHGPFKEEYVPSLVRTARVALLKAGVNPERIAFLSMVNANLRVLELTCDALGLSRERSSADYLVEYGHFGAPDVFFNIDLALNEGRIHAGDLVLLLTTGIGFFWVAAVLRC